MIRLSENTEFAERYILKRLLGRGGFSEVWLATDKITGLEIAIKIYAPGYGIEGDGMKDFCKELSQVYNLNNTYLLKPQHVDNWEGMPYLVMPYCKKGSCQHLIGKITEEQAWKLIHDVSSGLDYLHKQEIIHQDIKPDNILIDQAGNYVITDFGISVQSRSTLRKSMNITSTSGTTAYMGPERFSSNPMPIKASDIWSLGATVYELITGVAPFGEIGGGMQKGGADLPSIKNNISPKLRKTISKMLALEPWDRPTAEQLIIDSSTPNNEDSSTNQTPAKQTTHTNTRTKWILISIAALFLIVIGAYTWKNLHDKKEQEKINIHLKISTDCDKYISDLNDVNILDKFDFAVEKIRDLERFEKKNKDLKKTFSAEKIKALQAQLLKIRGHLEYERDNTYIGYDKNGKLYQDMLYKIKYIDTIITEIKYSGSNSAKDIHISKDDI